MVPPERVTTMKIKNLPSLFLFLALCLCVVGAPASRAADDEKKDDEKKVEDKKEAAGDKKDDDKKPDDEKKSDGRAFEIRLAREIKVGDKYAATCDGAMTRRLKVTGGGQVQEQPEEGFGVHLEATVEVLALDSIGEEAKVSCTVDRCTRITTEGETELLKKGTVFIAEGKGKDTVFSLKDGGELSKDAKEALDLVISLDTNDTVTDDQMFGTKEKKKVGESWPADAKAVAEDAKRVNVTIDPADVEGSFKIDGVEQAQGVECLRLSGNLKVKKLTRKADEDKENGGLPEGFAVDGGSMESKYAGLFPVDVSKGSLAESASMAFVTHIKGKGPDGGEVTIDNRVQRAVEMKRRFLDK